MKWTPSKQSALTATAAAGLVTATAMLTLFGTGFSQTPEQYQQAANALQAGNFTSACSQYQTLHKANPNEPHALFGLAMCARHEGDPNKAGRILQGLFQTQPNFAPAQLLMGELLDEQGQATVANKHYAEYARLAKLQGIPLPKDPKVRIRLRQVGH